MLTAVLPSTQRSHENSPIRLRPGRLSKHPADHTHGHGSANRNACRRAKMLLDIAKLVAVIRRCETGRTQRAGAVAALVRKSRLWREVSTPAGRLEPPAE